MIATVERTLIAGLSLDVLIAVVTSEARAASDCDTLTTTTVRVRDQFDPVYDGKKLSYWLRSIRKRDIEMAAAFDAIRALGPLAWPAVPMLERIVAAPFTPLKIGEDKQETVLYKLLEIQLRADAVDALAAIGPAAACSTRTLIRWGLKLRVVPLDVASAQTHDIFSEIVGIDVLERMRVAGAVPQLGRDALLTAAPLLTSEDGEERKFAVAILAERTIPIAVSLLKSKDCEKKRLGFAILTDMWPVVSQVHLLDLKAGIACDTN